MSVGGIIDGCTYEKIENSNMYKSIRFIGEIEKEISVIVVRNDEGKITFFPSVEMLFDKKLNLV